MEFFIIHRQSWVFPWKMKLKCFKICGNDSLDRWSIWAVIIRSFSVLNWNLPKRYEISAFQPHLIGLLIIFWQSVDPCNDLARHANWIILSLQQNPQYLLYVLLYTVTTHINGHRFISIQLIKMKKKEDRS